MIEERKKQVILQLECLERSKTSLMLEVEFIFDTIPLEKFSVIDGVLVERSSGRCMWQLYEVGKAIVVSRKLWKSCGYQYQHTN